MNRCSTVERSDGFRILPAAPSAAGRVTTMRPEAGRTGGSVSLRRTQCPLTLLCIATYRKGDAFLEECQRQGCRVLLLTEEKLRDADWAPPRHRRLLLLRRDMPPEDIRTGAAYQWPAANDLDRIVALDDSTSRPPRAAANTCTSPHGRDDGAAFRDKPRCASGPAAPASGVRRSSRCSTRRRNRVGRTRLFPPGCSSRGRRRPRSDPHTSSTDQLWEVTTRSETARRVHPRAVHRWRRFHVDSRVSDRRVVSSTPVTTGLAWPRARRGIFARGRAGHRPGERGAEERERARLDHSGCCGASRTPSSSAAGTGSSTFSRHRRAWAARSSSMSSQAATGVNLWREWRRSRSPARRPLRAAGVATAGTRGSCFARAASRSPDMSAYDAPEIVKRIRKSHHAGLIVASAVTGRVRASRFVCPSLLHRFPRVGAAAGASDRLIPRISSVVDR